MGAIVTTAAVYDGFTSVVVDFSADLHLADDGPAAILLFQDDQIIGRLAVLDGPGEGRPEFRHRWTPPPGRHRVTVVVEDLLRVRRPRLRVTKV